MVRLPSPNPNGVVTFGQPVLLSGDRLVVGTHSGEGYVREPVYAYELREGAWMLDARLDTLQGERMSYDTFGQRVVLSGDRMVMDGEEFTLYSDSATSERRSSVLSRTTAGWEVETTLRLDTTEMARSTLLSLAGDVLAVGSEANTTVAIYRWQYTQWQVTGYLSRPDVAPQGGVATLSTDGSTVLVTYGYLSQVYAYDLRQIVATEPPPALAQSVTAQIYPNPAQDQATLAFSLPAPGHVEVSVFDVTGRLVMAIDAGMRTADVHYLPINTSALVSGTYVYRITTAAKTLSGTMLLVR